MRSPHLMILTVGLLIGGGGALAADPTKAVWQVQETHFSYHGFTTYYSCDGLRDKMRDILRELGARDDMLVSAGGCDTMSGPSKLSSARILVANPVAATPGTTGVADDKKRDELLKRMQRDGASKARKEVSDAPFNAEYKKVVLLSKGSGGLGVGAAGDCELLEQVRDRLLPKLGVKVVKDTLRCVPYQSTVGNPALEVEVLVESRS